MRELIDYIARALVDNPDAVSVSEIEGNHISDLDVNMKWITIKNCGRVSETSDIIDGQGSRISRKLLYENSLKRFFLQRFEVI